MGCASAAFAIKDTMKHVKELFERYHRFDDGLIKSIEVTYGGSGSLSVDFMFYARDHSAIGDIWRNVIVRVGRVSEVMLSAHGEVISSISSSVKLLSFGDLWCVEVDGTYAYGDDPRTIEEIRKYGTCYAFGRDVEAIEISETG